MVLLRSQSKITDLFMILAWACPFKLSFGIILLLVIQLFAFRFKWPDIF